MSQATSDKNNVLMTIDNVRLVKNDDLNVIVERLEEVTDKKTKQVKQVWKFKGYYGTIINALSAISSKEWLIDESAVTDLKSYLKEVNESDAKILKAIERVMNDESRT